MSKILILGSNHINTSTAYQHLELPPSILVDQNTKEYTVGHTARQEFTTDQELEEVLTSADDVYWADPGIDEFDTKETYYNFVEWLKKYQHQHNNVRNFDIIKFDPYGWNLELPTLTVDDAVFLGCSITSGVGLSNTKDHYATQVSAHFNKNCVNLARGGGSNYRSVEIFSQLKFVPGQIVVIQMTHMERIRYCLTDRTFQDLMFNKKSKYSKQLIEIYHKDFLFFELLTNLRNIIQIARLKQLKLVFWLINYKNPDVFSQQEQLYFYEFPEFVPAYLMENYIVDQAEDNLHPGIKSNINVAKTLIGYIEKVYK